MIILLIWLVSDIKYGRNSGDASKCVQSINKNCSAYVLVSEILALFLLFFLVEGREKGELRSALQLDVICYVWIRLMQLERVK